MGDVDRSKVLTADSIMIPALTSNIYVDGNCCFEKMTAEEVSGLVAVNRHRQLEGYLSSEEAVRARREKLPLADVLTEMPKIKPDTLIMDIMPIIYDAQTPVAVVRDNRLKGVVIRGAVLKALADTEGEDDNE